MTHSDKAPTAEQLARRIAFGDVRLPHRFWDRIKIDGETGCWLWTAARNKAGYGIFWVSGDRTRLAHRVAYQTLVGDIAPQLHCDHLCRTHQCVNPNHIEAVTASENHRRGVSDEVTSARHARVTHCPSGHEYSAQNTYIARDGCRHCRTCKTLRDPKSRAYKLARKMEARTNG